MKNLSKEEVRTAEEIAYATWRKLVNQNWSNVGGEIQAAIEEYSEKENAHLRQQLAKKEQESKNHFKSWLRSIDIRESVKNDIMDYMKTAIHWSSPVYRMIESKLNNLFSDSEPQFKSQSEAVGWISVKDRLPEEYQAVLAYDPDMGTPEWVDYWTGKTWGNCNNNPPTVTHWMPLPNPPKGEQLQEERKPHSFCEKPDSNCTMNCCDENGCNERKRHLVKEEGVQEVSGKAVYSEQEVRQNAIDFAAYMQSEAWEYDYREQKTHNLSEHYDNFIN